MFLFLRRERREFFLNNFFGAGEKFIKARGAFHLFDAFFGLGLIAAVKLLALVGVAQIQIGLHFVVFIGRFIAVLGDLVHLSDDAVFFIVILFAGLAPYELLKLLFGLLNPDGQ